MIHKTENPLNFDLDQIEFLIVELQASFDTFSDDLGPFTLDESGVSIDITTQSGKYSYNLEQLKQLKTKMLDPAINSPKDIS